MVTQAFFELLKQFFSEPATNLFPVKAAPDNVHRTLKAVERGKKRLNAPVEVPVGFRGKVEYDRQACIGCQMCLKVCPSMTIEYIKDEKKVKFYMARCTFCALCTEICPKKCIRMSDTFIMANTDKYGKDMIVIDSGNFTGSLKKEESKPVPKEAPKEAPKALKEVTNAPKKAPEKAKA